MRRLLLLRHAKAAPPAGGDDHERALTDRGREDGRRIGDLIAARGLVPDLLIYSSAERTRETAEIVATNWPKRVKSVAEDGLYEASRQFMLLKIRTAPDRAGVVMIVGHNPGNRRTRQSADGRRPEGRQNAHGRRFPDLRTCGARFLHGALGEHHPPRRPPRPLRDAGGYRAAAGVNGPGLARFQNEILQKITLRREEPRSFPVTPSCANPLD